MSLSDRAFEYLEVCAGTVGLAISADKQNLYEARLYTLSSSLDFSSVSSFLETSLESKSNVSLIASSIVARNDRFVRIPRKFAEEVVHQFTLRCERGDRRPLNVVCAGGGDFLEAISVSIAFKKLLQLSGGSLIVENWDLRPFDLNRRMLQGYSDEEVQRDLTTRDLGSHFERAPEGWVPAPEFVSPIIHIEHNLLHKRAAMEIDALICFDVLPHMTIDGSTQVIRNLAAALRSGALIYSDGWRNLDNGDTCVAGFGRGAVWRAGNSAF